MRGKGGNCVFVGGISGITPAYAGKSRAFIKQIQNVWDHPRLCGEKLPQQPRFCWAAGSPPPMRGKVLRSFVHHLSTRITPAYAGKRNKNVRERRLKKDHPRLCGEKCSLVSCQIRYTGSPPPMRGKGPIGI